jgi:sugar phosphate isomerase/epimerase
VGILSLGYSHRRLRLEADAVAMIRRFRVRHLEMRIDEIGASGPMRDAAFRRDLRILCENEGLTLSFHALAGVNLAEKIERLREVCVDMHCEQLEFCEAVGASWLNLHLGTCGFGQDARRKADRLAIAGDSLDRLVEKTAGMSVGLGLENVERLPDGLKKAYLGDRLDELRAVLDPRGDRIGAVLDIGHANINPERPTVDLLASLSHRLLSVHVHANAGDSDHHAPLTLDWVDARRPLFDALARVSSTGVPLIAEHHTVEDATATLSLLQGISLAP